MSLFVLVSLKFFLAGENKSILCVKESIINYAKFFCRSCLAFCETSLFDKFSWIALKNSENAAISFLTVVCLDV